MIDWLYSNALGAAALAVVAGVAIWTFRPGPAVRHALWLVVLLKLVSPTGLWVSVPLPVEAPAAEERVPTPGPSPQPESEYGLIEEHQFTLVLGEVPAGAAAEEDLLVEAAAADEVAPPRVWRAEPAVEAPAAPFDYRAYLIAAWVLGAGYFGWRSVRESLKFSRFARRSVPAADHLRAEVAAVARGLGVRTPAVRVLAGLSSPLMWCLGRPVLLWPAGLDSRLKGEGRRAVIAHELAHLRRRDHWVRRLEMVAAVLHWWNPLFWVARKRLRADAELACDAWAAGQADRRAYAEALLEVCSFNHRRRPAPAVGVSGEGRRAMQERLSMIMREHVPCRLAFGAKLVVALMVVAAVPAWTLGQAKPTKAEKAADPDVQKIEAQLKALTEKLAAVRAAKQAEEAAKRAEADAQKAGEDAKARAGATLKLQLLGEAKDKLIEKTAGAPNVKVLTAGQDGVKVIGADGKELKDVKVIIVDSKTTKTAPAEGPKKVELRMTTPPAVPAPPSPPKPPVYEWKVAPGGQNAFQLQWANPPAQGTPAEVNKYYLQGAAAGGEGQTVTLSRATYKLEKGQADALAGLLGSVKASILELKVDGNTLTLTTTPDVQATVGQIVKLITGQGTGGHAMYRVAPAGQAAPVLAVPAAPPAPPAAAVPAAPAVPRAPKAPTPPAAPDKPAAVEQIEVHVVPGVKAGDKEVRVEVLRDLEKLKDLDKTIRVDVLKDLEKLKDLDKTIRVDVLKDLEKLKDLKELKELKDVKELKDLRIELKLDELKDLKIDTAELKARIEKAVEQAKKAEKKPAGPAK